MAMLDDRDTGRERELLNVASLSQTSFERGPSRGLGMLRPQGVVMVSSGSAPLLESRFMRLATGDLSPIGARDESLHELGRDRLAAADRELKVEQDHAQGDQLGEDDEERRLGAGGPGRVEDDRPHPFADGPVADAGDQTPPSSWLAEFCA